MRKEIYPLINTWAIREPEAFSGEAVFFQKIGGGFFSEHQQVNCEKLQKIDFCDWGPHFGSILFVKNVVFFFERKYIV